MDLSNATHSRQSLDGKFGIQEWKDFILKEELIRYERLSSAIRKKIVAADMEPP